MDRTKKILISLLVLGALAAVGTGTYATFNAQTTNSGNQFVTGTIILSDSINSGSACYSNASAATGTAATIGSGNNNATCAAVFSNTVLNKPNVPYFSGITLTNAGNLNASSVTLTQAGCAGVSAGGSAAGTDTAGFCGKIDVDVNEIVTPTYFSASTASAASAATSMTVATLPSAPATGTVFTLLAPNGTTQSITTSAGSTTTTLDFTGTPLTSAYASGTVVYSGGSTSCALGSCTSLTAVGNGKQLTGITTATSLGGTLAATASRYFIVGLELDNTTADNSDQGLTTGPFTLSWTIS